MHDDRFGRNKLLCTYTYSNSKFDEILVDFNHKIFTLCFLIFFNPAVVARKHPVFKYQAL